MKLNLAGRDFRDWDVEDLRFGRRSYQYEEVDFSQNQLSTDGLRTVVDICMRCENLRILKLYKNGLDDSGAEALVELIWQCESLDEMHLSHNNFTARGAMKIVKAAEKSRPWGVRPLWLRLEKNRIETPQRLLQDFQTKLSVCNRENANQCTVHFCAKNCKVHLPYFLNQRQHAHEDAGHSGDMDANGHGMDYGTSAGRRRDRGDGGSWRNKGDWNGKNDWYHNNGYEESKWDSKWDSWGRQSWGGSSSSSASKKGWDSWNRNGTGGGEASYDPGDGLPHTSNRSNRGDRPSIRSQYRAMEDVDEGHHRRSDGFEFVSSQPARSRRLPPSPPHPRLEEESRSPSPRPTKEASVTMAEMRRRRTRAEVEQEEESGGSRSRSRRRGPAKEVIFKRRARESSPVAARREKWAAMVKEEEEEEEADPAAAVRRRKEKAVAIEEAAAARRKRTVKSESSSRSGGRGHRREPVQEVAIRDRQPEPSLEARRNVLTMDEATKRSGRAAGGIFVRALAEAVKTTPFVP